MFTEVNRNKNNRVTYQVVKLETRVNLKYTPNHPFTKYPNHLNVTSSHIFIMDVYKKCNLVNVSNNIAKAVVKAPLLISNELKTHAGFGHLRAFGDITAST